jgi:hypothetical protein
MTAGAAQLVLPEFVELELWPDMEDSVRLFMALSTQWRLHPMGGALGLDYGCLADTAMMMGFVMAPQMFEDVRALEAGALQGLREQQRQRT